jgi:hypothetical protein
MHSLSHIRKMAIITSFLKGEHYGLLGPQLAGTIVEHHTPCECIVIAVSRDDDKAVLETALGAYFGNQMAVVGFTALSGRTDLCEFAGALKSKGAVTLLAGPQAAVDFSGEVGWQEHPHRFRGVSDFFSFALQGPAEQIIPLFVSTRHTDPCRIPGLVYRSEEGLFFRNPASPWNEKYLGRVDWNRLYTTSDTGLTPLAVEMGQVLQHIGCPHAARKVEIEIDYPVALSKDAAKKVLVGIRGCSFCDVAADKGFHGKLGLDTVVGQIAHLPVGADGRKIPFELINESPLPGLAGLLEEVKQRGIPISQLNLTLRADWLAAGGDGLRRALQAVRRVDAKILLSSIGFESFDDTILKNLNKGLTREKNLAAVRLIRRLKEDFPHQLEYTSGEGAIHGFIHPTPWDSKRTESAIQKTIGLYGLQQDILPPHSTPLIIHHASALADWIRRIERRENIRYRRHGSIIAWWDAPL